MFLIVLFAIGIIFVVGFIVLEYTYLRKLKRLQRVVGHSILTFGFIVAISSVPLFFVEEMGLSLYFGLVLIGLIFSIILGIGNYLALNYNDGRMERLRKKWTQLPDGPDKERKLQFLDNLEKYNRKWRSFHSSLNSNVGKGLPQELCVP